jgi:hypothetical protein
VVKLRLKGFERREGEEERGEGGRKGNTYVAATKAVFFPDILGLNFAPIVVMSFLRYSLASPV